MSDATLRGYEFLLTDAENERDQLKADLAGATSRAELAEAENRRIEKVLDTEKYKAEQRRARALRDLEDWKAIRAELAAATSRAKLAEADRKELLLREKTFLDARNAARDMSTYLEQSNKELRAERDAARGERDRLLEALDQASCELEEAAKLCDALDRDAGRSEQSPLAIEMWQAYYAARAALENANG